MTNNFDRLTKTGFEPAGKWQLGERCLKLILYDSIEEDRSVLCAFAVDGALVYVGKNRTGFKKAHARIQIAS